MLVLLPPSEAKTPPRSGPPVDLSTLSAPSLAGPRERLLDAVAGLAARPDAGEVLGVGPGAAADVARNAALRTAPAAPAARLYTGVLYAAAGLPGLTGAARARAARVVRIFSGLWGVLTPADRIPAYRLAMGVDLPGVGRLASYWRHHLPAVLAEQAAGRVVVDCRSAAYAAAWRPPASATHLLVQVVRERDGHRRVVSHHAKHARGLLTHHLLTRPGRLPRSAEEVASAAAEMPTTAAGTAGGLHAVELGDPVRGRRTLTLVTHG
ncbi:peroxide stress protein YaaA [Georgenia sp. TF02-10]|uniref:YaaA family protein n=1 Tax=Georgenia sp. TF02-10 TaxID=2917725 RepID=UPI001FA7CCCC|nr:peroxide stress protein YaaA [Georgenia sp. TF02-10]UNX53461.1 peroxide stress protein YaaA [Georgenia sp. TF02-10]